MSEEKKKSFAEMFKKQNNGDEDSSSGSVTDNKFGIVKKNHIKDLDDQSFADKMAAKKSSVSSLTEGMEAKKSSDDGHAESVRKRRSDLVYLVRGNDRGKAAWHYVLVDKMKKAMFLAASKSGTLDVADYGEVLHSGWGKDPPEDIVNKVKSEFNIQ